jgi:hypothetical protein
MACKTQLVTCADLIHAQNGWPCLRIYFSYKNRWIHLLRFTF